MPIDPTIPLNQVAFNPMASLSSVLSNANAVQQLRNAQLQNQIGQNTLQQGNNATTKSDAYISDMQTAHQLLSSGNYNTPDDTVDLGKLQTDFSRVAKNPENISKIIGDFADAGAKITTAKQAITNLNSDNRQIAGGMLGTAIGQPQEVQSKIINTMLADGNIGPAIKPAFDALVGKNIYSPDQATRDKALTTLQRFAYTAQFKKPDASIVNTDKGGVFTNTNPASDTPVGPIAGTPTITPPNITVATTNGGTASANLAKGTIAPLTPTTQGGPTASLPQGETNDTQKTYTGKVLDAQTQAGNARTAQDINQSILKSLDNGATTGHLSNYITAARSVAGGAMPDWMKAILPQGMGGSAPDSNYSSMTQGAAETQILAKLLARQTLNQAAGGGLTTNQGRELSEVANGSTTTTAPALRKIVQLNQAYNTHDIMYNDAVQRATQNGANPFALRQLDQDWNSAKDIRALKLKNAIDNGNTADAQEILKEVGGKGSAGAKALAKRLSQMRALSGDQ